MLGRKGVDYRERELHRWLLPRLGFDGNSVPAFRVGKQRIQGTRSISRWLDEHKLGAPLFPVEPELRQAVADAEAWGDEVLQGVARRLYLWGLSRDRRGLERLARLSSVPAPGLLGPLTAGIAVRQLAKIRGATDARIRDDLAELPAMLDRIDAWINEGILGGNEPNAADLQLAPSLAVLISMEDLRSMIEPRPAAELAALHAPDFPSCLSPGVLPAR